MLRKWIGLLATIGGCLLLTVPSQAQKQKKVETPKEQIQEERMQKLITAYDLAAQGRTKNAPEYLITAAGMLRQLSSIKDLQDMKVSDVKPEIKGDGKADLDKQIKAPTLSEQSDELFKEASDMGATLNVNVDKLIKLAKERETTDKEERAVVGGPQQIGHLIGAGQHHSYKFMAYTGQPFYWAFQASSPLRVSVVHDENQNAFFLGTTRAVSKSFMPKFHPNPSIKVATITVLIINNSKVPAQYQMVMQ